MTRAVRRLIRPALAAALAVGVIAPLTLAPSPAHAQGKNDLKVDMDVKSFTLDNGLRVYVVEDHSTPAFNISIAYDVGSVDEVKGRTGFAHFFEHMMFMGSEKMGKFSIGNYTEAAGGNFNAFTSFDFTLYFHNIPSNYLEMVLWGESDRLAALDINDKTFEDQRAAVKSEKDRGDNQPYSPAIQYDFLPTLMAGTPYDHTPIGSLDDLNAAETADVKKFFDMYYRPNNAVMVVVGDVDFANVQKLVTDYFGGIPKGEAKPPLPEIKMTYRDAPLEKKVADPNAQQTIYFFGWPTVGDDHPDRPALELLSAIMLTGQSSRIPKILTDEKKLTVGAGGAHQGFRHAGAVFMSAVPAPGAKLDDIKAVVKEELEKVAKKGVSKKELEKAVNQQLMSTVSTLASNQGRALAVASGALFYDDPKRVITDLDRYREVTPADIKRVAEKYFGPNWVLYEIGPG